MGLHEIICVKLKKCKVLQNSKTSFIQLKKSNVLIGTILLSSFTHKTQKLQTLKTTYDPNPMYLPSHLPITPFLNMIWI